MFATFFHELKQAGLPVTLREYLTLMEAMERDLAGRRVEDFYYLSRAALVKDERNLDKFDRVFGHVFKGLYLIEAALSAEIPAEWARLYLPPKFRQDDSAGLHPAEAGHGTLHQCARIDLITGSTQPLTYAPKGRIPANGVTNGIVRNRKAGSTDVFLGEVGQNAVVILTKYRIRSRDCTASAGPPSSAHGSRGPHTRPRGPARHWCRSWR